MVYLWARRYLKVKEKTILWEAFYGRGIVDNPRALFEAVLKDPDFKKWNHIWVLDDLKNRDVIFDRIFFIDPFANLGGINSLCESLAQIQQEEYFAPNWQVVISQKIPSKGQKISNLIKEQILVNFNVDEETLKIVEQMQNIEQEFFTDKENPLFNWNQETIQKLNNDLFKLEKENYDPTLVIDWPLSTEGKEYFEDNCKKIELKYIDKSVFKDIKHIFFTGMRNLPKLFLLRKLCKHLLLSYKILFQIVCMRLH